MTDDRPLSADRVPTLTEVVELDLPVPQAPRVDVGHDPAPRDAAAADIHQAMADDFVLAGLETDAVVTDAEFEGVALAPAAGTPALDGQATEHSDTDALPDDVSRQARIAAVEPAEPAEPEAAPERPAALASTAPLPVQVPSSPQPLPVVDVDAVAGQVLSELMPRIDMLLESRLREALAPALARAADGLIRDTRANLAVAVRDLVQEAVDRALQRRADR